MVPPDTSKGRARGFSTRAVHGSPDEVDVPPAPVVEPIQQSVSFEFDSADQFADVINRRSSGYSYGRLENPTHEALARVVASLEGAEAGMTLASGMAALHAAVLTVARAGDRIVAARALYGGTFGLLTQVLPRYGIATEFVDFTDLGAIERALQAKTCAVLCETIGNPTLQLCDLEALSGMCRTAGARLIVDNTFASPYLCNPVALGADLVMHSATKYLGGHGDVIAGVLVGARDLVDGARELTVDVGGICSPLSAWLCLRGIRTLALRMERHSQIALRIARTLQDNANVERVIHPALDSFPQRELARKQLRLGGGMVAFELRGGFAAGRRFMDRLTLIRRAGSLGAVHSLVLHPASTSHRQLSPDELRAGGISEGFVRLSVGLEDYEDLMGDLTDALS